MKMGSRIRELRRTLKSPPTTWIWYIASMFSGGVILAAFLECGSAFGRISPKTLGYTMASLTFLVLFLSSWIVLLKNELGVQKRFIEKNHGLVDADKKEWEEEVFDAECERIEKEKRGSEPNAVSSRDRQFIENGTIPKEPELKDTASEREGGGHNG